MENALGQRGEEMNIHDVDIEDLQEEYKDADKFEAMYNLQKKLAADYGIKILNIDTKKAQLEIKDKIFCCTEELYEMVNTTGNGPFSAQVEEKVGKCVKEMFELANTLKNRPWAKTEVPVDRGHFQDELADAMAFFFEILILSGMTPEELFEIYLRKMKVNQFRQRSGY